MFVYGECNDTAEEDNVIFADKQLELRGGGAVQHKDIGEPQDLDIVYIGVIGVVRGELQSVHADERSNFIGFGEMIILSSFIQFLPDLANTPIYPSAKI